MPEGYTNEDIRLEILQKRDVGTEEGVDDQVNHGSLNLDGFTREEAKKMSDSGLKRRKRRRIDHLQTARLAFFPSALLGRALSHSPL